MAKSRYFKLIASAMLIALSILLTRLFAGNFLVLGVPAARFSLGFLPIMLSGVLLGPGWGAAVGLIADVLGFFMFPNGVYFPPIATTSMLAGFLPGLIILLWGRKSRRIRTLCIWLSVAAVQIFGSLLLQTYWLSLLYGKGFVALIGPRAVISLVLIPVYALLIQLISAALHKAGLAPNLTR